MKSSAAQHGPSTLENVSCAEGAAVAAYMEFYGDDPSWIQNMAERLKALEGGILTPKQRALVFTAGLLVVGETDAAREYAAKARAAGATDADLKLIARILEHYRGLRLMQDAQKIVTFWCEGHFPKIRETANDVVEEMLSDIEKSRGYIANGFRVYSADGNWLRLYIGRSDANKAYGHTLTPAEVQLLSFVITMRNHMYSANFNDGCILVHERLARKGGMDSRHILESLQILEVCDAMVTRRQAANLF